MENRGVEELVVHLDQALDLTSMEQGVKLIGKVLTSKLVNKWGVRNILRSTWKDLGEVDIKWVRDNTFLILVQDESMASKILEQVPWAVMKKVFSVKKWPPELALEEVEMETVPFWVQIRGVPLGSTSATNIQRLTQAAGQFIALEDPGKARGFLRVRILIDTGKPLCNGCWIRRTITGILGWSSGMSGYKTSVTAVDVLGMEILNALFRFQVKGRLRMESGQRRLQ
ncbi:hypothetical protein ACFX2B_008494 [Malus domestica]